MNHDACCRTISRTTALEPGWTYRVEMADGTVCSFDLTTPRQVWALPPRAREGVPVEAARQDWMLVIDEAVELQRGQAVTARVLEESGSTWTWTGAPPNRVVRTSTSEPSVTVAWR